MWLQKQIQLKARSRGFHLVTDEIIAHLPELHDIQIGLAHFFLQHTSASLTLNENADPGVRRDMETYARHAIPDNTPYFVHTQEGPDDMTAHIKSSLFGANLLIPINRGRLALGVWQGIWLGEHRDHGGSRRVLMTLHGE